MAISRQKKEMTVEKAKEQLENCSLIASINYKRFTVRKLGMHRSEGSLSPARDLSICHCQHTL